MTANDIIEGASMAIARAVPGAEITMEDMAQELPEPGFSIAAVQTGRRRLVGRRYSNTVTLDVRYFPGPGNDQNREMHGVAETLYTALEMITTTDGEKVLGSSMNHEIVDNVLHFMVTFTSHLLRDELSGPLLEEYEQTLEVQDGKSN